MWANQVHENLGVFALGCDEVGCHGVVMVFITKWMTGGNSGDCVKLTRKACVRGSGTGFIAQSYVVFI
jgi:hypothetical protein